MDHPITPPPELVLQWYLSAKALPVDQWVTDVATAAAQWGADQELEACCEWLAGWCRDEYPGGIENLRAARRPKPPSLKEQALSALHRIADGKGGILEQHQGLDTIRQALEALPDD